MAYDIRTVKSLSDLIRYFSQVLKWEIDISDFDEIDDITYDFGAEDIGLKEEAFAKISSLRQLQPLVEGQKWGIFCVEFDSKCFEVSALRKILSGLIPKRRNSADHAVWKQHDLLFICNWGVDNNRTIGIAHFEDRDKGLPQIKLISCAPAAEDFTQIQVFENRLSQLAWPSNTSEIDNWRASWVSAFTAGYRQTIVDSSSLTIQLAAEAQNIRDRILDIIKVESQNGYVHLLYEKFKSTLIHNMTVQEFADMYAQTVVYGLFSARCMDKSQDDFSAAEAINCIPNTNPFLKSLMRECIGTENNSKLSFDELEISNVVEILLHTKTESIIQDFNRQTGGGREDPVIHFYEEFLTAYDKTQKVQRGVFYTPQPVVNFIVRAVDTILKAEFGLEDGLATDATKKIIVKCQSKKKIGGLYQETEKTIDVPAIQLLDPATGTGTFLRQAILQIYENFIIKHKGESLERIASEWNTYVPEQLLPRLNGFELMMAPYAVAHMKIAMVLKDTGYDFSCSSRLNVYLTNTLEEPGSSEAQMTLFDDPLALESVEANVVKKNSGINVIIGNPPYSTESSNKGEWISDLMNLYKKEPDGITKLKERNSKPLNDDYIKFIRYGQYILKKSNRGILAFINPHGFTDGPIYRGMRSALLRDFDTIYILDLHGNANRQERALDGGKDENVFDIKQGVCIVLLVKNSSIKKKAKVYRGDLYGTRDAKYRYLQESTLSQIDWTEIVPSQPLNLFCREDASAKNSYEAGISIRDLFDVNGTGILTKRDQLCIQFNPEAAFEAAEAIATKPKEEVTKKYCVADDVRDWKYEWAKADVLRNKLNPDKVMKITYRPFDDRYTYYTGESRGFMGWPVYSVMQHMMNKNNNIALVTARSNKAGNSTHFFVSRNIVEYKCGERTTNSSVFPLYNHEDGAFDATPNFKEVALREIEKRLGLIHSEKCANPDIHFSAYDLFAYIYAIFYSPSFRDANKDFINRDFPVVPYPATTEQFWKLSELGNRLIKAHLLEDVSTKTQVSLIGIDTIVQKVDYKNGRVYINNTSYFDNIEEETWSFIIGGYQPCQRWLKERKCVMLMEDDVTHYEMLVEAINQTRVVMGLIDREI